MPGPVGYTNLVKSQNSKYTIHNHKPVDLKNYLVSSLYIAQKYINKPQINDILEFEILRNLFLKMPRFFLLQKKYFQ